MGRTATDGNEITRVKPAEVCVGYRFFIDANQDFCRAIIAPLIAPLIPRRWPVTARFLYEVSREVGEVEIPPVLHPQRAPIHVEQRLLLLDICRLLTTHADELAQHLHVEAG